MAFGFPAFHEEVLEVPQARRDQLWSIFASLGWRGSTTSDGVHWVGSTSMSLSSWGEKVTVSWVGPSQIRVRSECSMPTQCFDWGKNKRNVDALRGALWG